MLYSLKLESCISRTSDLHLFFRVVKDNRNVDLISAALVLVFLLVAAGLWAFDSTTGRSDGWLELIAIIVGTLSSSCLFVSYAYMKKRAFNKRLRLLPKEYHEYDRNYFLRFIMFLEEARMREVCERRIFEESSSFLGEDMVASNRLGLSNSFSFVLSAGLAIFFVQSMYNNALPEVQLLILSFSSLFVILSATNIWAKNLEFARKAALRQYCHWAANLDDKFFEQFKKQS